MSQRKRHVYRACKECAGARTDENPISTRGLCQDCAIERQTFAARELHDKNGPAYERWREAMQRARI